LLIVVTSDLGLAIGLGKALRLGDGHGLRTCDKPMMDIPIYERVRKVGNGHGI
jgi:hypothetical protein